MRISDWSSDVCSSDLVRRACHDAARELKVKLQPAGYASVPDRYHITMLFLGDQVSSAHEASALQAARLVRMAPFTLSSDERRVGEECVSTCRSRWSPYNSKHKHN